MTVRQMRKDKMVVEGVMDVTWKAVVPGEEVGKLMMAVEGLQ